MGPRRDWTLLAKVGRDDVGVAQHVRRRAVGDALTEIEHRDVICDLLHHRHVVVDDEDGQAVPLEALEQANPELATPDSPTQRVGSDLDARLPKIRHPVPMLSLSKAYSADDLRTWRVWADYDLGQTITSAFALGCVQKGRAVIATFQALLITLPAVQVVDGVRRHLQAIGRLGRTP